MSATKDLEPFVKVMYRALELFWQHDPSNMGHIQGNTIGHAGSGTILEISKLVQTLATRGPTTDPSLQLQILCFWSKNVKDLSGNPMLFAHILRGQMPYHTVPHS